MTTPRNLLIVALNPDSGRHPEQGEVSLALAGAELVDLLELRAIRLDGERIVPVGQGPTGDRLLDGATAALVRQKPYESVGDWLWRRGRGLAAVYLAAVEAERAAVGAEAPAVGAESAVDAVAERAPSGDVVLAALAAIAGLHGERTAAASGLADDAVATVLDAVDSAVAELGLARLRRSVEDAAFDNVWRGE